LRSSPPISAGCRRRAPRVPCRISYDRHNFSGSICRLQILRQREYSYEHNDMAIKKPSGDFFSLPTEASRRKQRIVVKYHAAWSQVLRSKTNSPGRIRQNLAYVDLFAGPGKYGDQSVSTPLLIIEAAARDPYMREHLLTRFNEGDPVLVDMLEKNIPNPRLPSSSAIHLKSRAPAWKKTFCGRSVVYRHVRLCCLPTHGVTKAFLSTSCLSFCARSAMI
jgi:hypothetical protein